MGDVDAAADDDCNAYMSPSESDSDADDAADARAVGDVLLGTEQCLQRPSCICDHNMLDRVVISVGSIVPVPYPSSLQVAVAKLC